MTSDYKKYSLEKLQEWVHDAMNSDASPHEIYSTIREAVREDYYYHKDCISRASGLLELLSGHRPVADKELFEAVVAEREYYEGVDESFEKVLQKEGYEWTPIQDKSEYYYDYDRNDLNKKNPSKNKVVRWQLPVQLDGLSGECYVQFPDDLLEAANLKEGDQVEWVDKGDGSCLLRKV